MTEAVLTALGLVFVIEGLVYALAPEGAKSVMKIALSLPEGRLRMVGLFAVTGGVLIVGIAKSFAGA